MDSVSGTPSDGSGSLPERKMLGPRILAASMVLRVGYPQPFKHGNQWQYHSRSDHHSKVACWGLLFDFLRHCPLARAHATGGKIGFGLNHEMRDFGTDRKKNLDLVICTPGPDRPDRKRDRKTFAEQAHDIGIILDDATEAMLSKLPVLRECPVGSVHIAVEAKACMTAFSKAKPRLYDELNSSHSTIHGNSIHAIAVGLSLVNIAEEFVSPGKNDFALSERDPEVTVHNQPRDAQGLIEKLNQLPRRTRDHEEGFDVFAITVVNCRNDGSQVHVSEDKPAPQAGEKYHYETNIHRLRQLYEQRFQNAG